MLDHGSSARGNLASEPIAQPGGGATAAGLSDRQFWITATVLAVVAASFEVQQLMVIPMMGDLASALETNATVTTWVVLSALISGAILTGPLCRLSDRIGPKKVYVLAASAVLVGNALCAIAITVHSAPLMLIGRMLVGINIAAAMGIAILKSLGTP
ncbi:MAG: MFS transporter, partial [Gordonia sp. (in: high G+C Gram-positive bacteria)]